MSRQANEHWNFNYILHGALKHIKKCESREKSITNIAPNWSVWFVQAKKIVISAQTGLRGQKILWPPFFFKPLAATNQPGSSQAFWSWNPLAVMHHAHSPECQLVMLVMLILARCWKLSKKLYMVADFFLSHWFWQHAKPRFRQACHASWPAKLNEVVQ